MERHMPCAWVESLTIIKMLILPKLIYQYHSFCQNSRKIYVAYFALTTMAQLVECRPTKRKVGGSIPGQSTCLGHGPSPQLGHMQE